MSRSLANLSANRITNDSNNNSAASHHRIGRAAQLIKKFFKPFSNTRDNNEMYEIIPRATSEQNINTIHRSESNNSDDGLVNRPQHHQSLVLHTTCPTTRTTKCRMHRTLSIFKNKIKSCRHEHTNPIENDQEKNNGYVVVEGNLDSELIFLKVDNSDQQATRHAAEPSIQMNEDQFNEDQNDLHQIQYASIIPATPKPSPPQQQTELGLSKILLDNHSRQIFEGQSTRSSAECAVPQSDSLNIYDTHISSPSSTNSSSHEYTGIDRTNLDDAEYVRAQQLDLDLLTMLGIDLSYDQTNLQRELNTKMEVDRLYQEALQQKVNLNKELKALQEKYNQIYLSWTCAFCTFYNQPYIETQRDICEVCESPSPLKGDRLTK